MDIQPIVLINAVGLTSRWLALAPRLRELARTGWSCPLEEIVPAVTCTAQASLLTGKRPDEHGIVGNGWLYRETGEVRFWQQSSALLAGRTDLRDRAPAGAGTRPIVQGGQAVLVVQPGSGRRHQRDAETVLWCRRQQGVRHHGNS